MTHRATRALRAAASYLLVLASCLPAAADYRAGMDAWDRGDLATASATLRAAAEAGDPRAQDQLGIMYEEGHGVERDDITAVFWYEKAAAQAFAPAQLNLGRMYRNGKGVEQDEAAAVRWYEQAARQGLGVAQFFLGLMYDTGKGVAQDPVAAYMWFSLAAAQGDQDAAFKRDRIASRLTEAELERARREGERLGPIAPPGSRVGYADSRDTRPPARGYETPIVAIPTPTPSQPPVVASPPDRPLSRAEIRELQRRLATLGLDPGPADGRPGPRTRGAVREFQRSRGLPATGEPTAALLAEADSPGVPAAVAVAAPAVAEAPAIEPAAATPGAGAAPPPIPDRVPSTGKPLVEAIQRLLDWLGYGPGPVDGVVGKATIGAARSFERDAGDAPSGKLTPGLLRSLIAEARRRGGIVAPVPLAAAPSAPPAPPPAVAALPAIEPTREPPDPFRLRGRALVLEFQRELTRVGLGPGPIDGVIGSRTISAARAFQRDQGASPDGRLTPALLREIQLAPGEAPAPVPAAEASTGAAPDSVAPSTPSAPLAEPAPGDEPPAGADPLVWAIQLALSRLGYDAGRADGVIGSRTVSAARSFQRDTGRTADGILGPTLRSQLDAALESGRPSRDMVRAIQERLLRLGYEPGTTDGLVGSRTVDAVRAFQRASGEDPDGRLSRELLQMLRRVAVRG